MRFPGNVVDDAVFLKPIRSALVAPHAGTDLPLPDCVGYGGGGPFIHRIKCCHQLRPSHIIAGLTASGLRRPNHSSWNVPYPATVLMFVSVLAALAGAAKPLRHQITFIYRRLVAAAGYDGHGDGRRMNTSPPLRWWDTLNTVAASFVVERSTGLRRKAEGYEPIPALYRVDFSAKLGGKSPISSSQVLDEQFRIVSAFGRSNFDMCVHA